MKIRTIEVGIGLTIPLAEYSNIKPFVQLSAELEAGEDPVEAHKILYENAKTLMVRQCHDLGETMQEILRTDLDSYVESFLQL